MPFCLHCYTLPFCKSLMYFLGTCKQHHFIAVFFSGNLFCKIQALHCQSSFSELFIGYHIFNKSIRLLVVCQVGNDDADTGRYDFPIFFSNNHMMIFIPKDIIPNLQKIIRFFRHRIIM